MRRSPVPQLIDSTVEPTAQQWDTLAKAAVKKAMQRKVAAEKRFMASLTRAVKQAVAQEKQQRKARAAASV